jgi:hypothetical protein
VCLKCDVLQCNAMQDSALLTSPTDVHCEGIRGNNSSTALSGASTLPVDAAVRGTRRFSCIQCCWCGQ